MSGDTLPNPKLGGAYEKELLDHLSKEILCQSELMMTFRTRVSFIVWLGPFIVVGALLVSAKEVPTSFNPGRLGWVCLTLAAGLYVVLGEVLARIEIHTWDQCNKWRTLVLQINAGLSEPPSDEKVVFEHDLKRGYRWVASMILIIFILLSVGAWQIIHSLPPNKPAPPQLPVSRSEPVSHEWLAIHVEGESRRIGSIVVRTTVVPASRSSRGLGGNAIASGWQRSVDIGLLCRWLGSPLPSRLFRSCEGSFAGSYNEGMHPTAQKAGGG